MLKRKVSAIQWSVIEDDTPVIEQLPHLPVRSFPVYHGGSYISLGFAFGGGEIADGCIGCSLQTPSAQLQPASVGQGLHYLLVYISDVSAMPGPTLSLLMDSTMEVLVIDVLTSQTHTSHFSLTEALDMVRQLKPIRTLLIGMSCSLGSHNEVSAELASLKDTEGMDVALAYDGLLVSGLQC